MSNQKYSSTHLRYLKARLANFSRPGFWGTGIFLVIIFLIVGKYGLNLPFLTQVENKEVENKTVTPKTEKAENSNEETTENKNEQDSLSEEAKAIAADIDNMPNLLSDFAKATLSTNITTTPVKSSNNQNNNRDNFLEDIINQQQNTAKKNTSLLRLDTVEHNASPMMNNPFLSEAQSLLQNGNGYSKNQFSGIKYLNKSSEDTETTNSNKLITDFNQQTTINQNLAITNPLEAGLQQPSNITQIAPVDTYERTITYTSQNLNNQNLNNQNIPSANRGYIQPNINYSVPSNYNNFDRVQTPSSSGITTNRTSTLPNNPNLVAPPIQNTTQSTNSLGYQNYSNYNPQQPSQFPNSNNLSNPGQLQQYSNGYQR